MIITSIELQKKNKTRYSIFIDGEFVCGVQDEIILRFKLSEGKEITQSELEQIQAEDEFLIARQATARYMMLRPHSSDEIQKYLSRKEFSAATINRVIDYYKEKGDINDALFAEKYIKSKRKLKPIGKLKLKRELMEKGVNKAIINESIQTNITDEEEQKIARHLLQKKLKTIKNKPKEKIFQSLYSYLQYHGISSQLAIDTIKKELGGEYENNL